MLSVRDVEELSDLGGNPSILRAHSRKPRRQPRTTSRAANLNIQSTSVDVNALVAAAKPSIAPEADPDDEDETELTGEEARLFRGVAARLNYVGLDRPDMQFAVKEAARLMSSPRRCDRRILRNISRYLSRRPRISLLFGWQSRPS